MSGASLSVHLLGPVTVRRGESILEVGVWKRKKAKALLALLALQRGRAIHRDVLISKLWPDADSKTALNHFNDVVFALREVLEPKREASGPCQYVHYVDGRCHLSLGPAGWLDVDLFENRMRAASTSHVDDRIFYLERAVELYSGPLASDLPKEEWCRAERGRLHEMYVAGLTRLAAEHEGKAALDAAAQCWRRILATDCRLEEAHRALISLNTKMRRWTEAAEQYQECTRILRESLAMSPDVATTSVYRRAVRWTSSKEDDARTSNE